MMPTILIGHKKEEALRSISNASHFITLIKRNMKDLSREGEEYFRYIQLELCNAGMLIGGIKGCERIFDSSDIVEARAANHEKSDTREKNSE